MQCVLESALLEVVEALLARGVLGRETPTGAGLPVTMRPRTGASVVAPAAIMDFTHPSPAKQGHVFASVLHSCTLHH